MSYWTEFNRITKRFEKKYGAKMNKALRAQVNTYIRTEDIGSIKSDQVYAILKDMYAEVGVNWAVQSGKYFRVKKARRPLGFTERIIRNLQEQYGIDLLNTSENITETTKKRIRQVLQDAAREGWSITEIVNRIQAPEVDAMRARLIARTEVISAANAGAMANAQTLGATHKVWISAIDKRTRRDHITLDGQKVGINEYFTVVDKNGVTRRMMQPGDKTGGPAQVCNCRCAVGFEMGPAMPTAAAPQQRAASTVAISQPIEINLENLIIKTIEEAQTATTQIIQKIENVNVNTVSFHRDMNIKEIAEKVSHVNLLVAKYKPFTKTTSLTNVKFASDNRIYGQVTSASSRSRSLNTMNQLVEVNFGHKTRKYVSPNDRAKLEVKMTPTTTLESGYQYSELYLNEKSIIDESKLQFATVTHEYAHLLTQSKISTPTFRIQHNEFWKAIKKLNKEYRTLVNNAINNKDEKTLDEIYLGQYAATNIDEFWAEGFAEFELNSNPSPFAKKIGLLAKKFFSNGGR